MDQDALTVVLAVVSSHLAADFWFQGDNDVEAKRRLRPVAFSKHAAIQAIAAYAFAGLWAVWEIPAVVLITHPVIDILKEASLRWLAPRDAENEPVTRWKFWAIIFDQLLHVAILAALVELLGRFGVIASEPYWSALLGMHLWLKVLVLLSGTMLAVFAGGVLVGVLVEPLLREMRGDRPPHEISADQRGLEKGGKIIGQLERALILLFVLSAQPAGVGFLIAAKSIFRFGELKDNAMRMEAEYIIIGTLLSFTWALLIAWITQWALSAI